MWHEQSNITSKCEVVVSIRYKILYLTYFWPNYLTYMLNILCTILCLMVWLCCALCKCLANAMTLKKIIQSYTLCGICVFILYTNFNWTFVFFFSGRIQLCIVTNILKSLTLTNFAFSAQCLLTVRNSKFHEIQFSGSTVLHVDRRTDMMKIRVVFCNC